MTARLSECFPASGQMCLHKVPLLWIRYEVWLQEWNGKCFCPEVKAPQTQPGIPLKQLTVGLYTCGCHFSCGQFFQGKLSNFGKPVIITFQRDIVLFTPDLICQSGGPALPYYIQPVLKFHLFVWSQRRKIHKPAP